MKSTKNTKDYWFSTTFRESSIGYGREIFCLARWLAEVPKDAAPVLVNSRLSARIDWVGHFGGRFGRSQIRKTLHRLRS
jgi:hypothetical protein